MFFSTGKRTGLIIPLTILFSIPAAAQDAIDTTRVYDLDEVIISASRWEQSPQSVGRNVTVISRREIERSLHTSVGELLSEQQSLHIVGDNQTAGSVQSVFLRNADSNHTVVMIDGVRISDPSTVGNSIDLAELSLAGVERIEIVRGSHSTLYGSSAIGGVINIITRGSSDTGFGGSVETTHGTFGGNTYSTMNALSASYSSDGGLYANLGVEQEWTRGLDATVDTVTSPTAFNPKYREEFNKLHFNGKLGYEGSNFSLHASWQKIDQGNDLDQSAYVDDDNAHIDFQRNLYSYGGSWSVSDRMELELSGAYSGLSRHFENDSSRVGASGNYDGLYTENRGEGTLWENELTWRFERAGISAIAGAGRSLQTMNTYNYTYSSAFDFEAESDLDSLDLHERINYVFAYIELDGSSINHSLEALTIGLGSRLSGHNQFGSNMTYEINPRYRITPSALLYGAVTTGFNAPSLYRLYSPARGFGSYTDRGNRNLEPETSVSYEAGWKQTIGSRLNLEIALFRTRVEHAIEYIYLWNGEEPIGSLGSADYRGDTYLNLSEQLVNGIELGVKARLLPGLDFSGNATYARSTVSFSPDDIDQEYAGGHHVQIFEGGQFVDTEKEVNGLVRRPKVSADASVTYRPSEKLEFGVNSRFVGINSDIFYSATLGPYGALDRSRVDSYSLTDLYAGYRITSRLSMKVKLKNIFDTRYTEINGYNTHPRTVYVRARYTF